MPAVMYKVYKSFFFNSAAGCVWDETSFTASTANIGARKPAITSVDSTALNLL